MAKLVCSPDKSVFFKFWCLGFWRENENAYMETYISATFSLLITLDKGSPTSRVAISDMVSTS